MTDYTDACIYGITQIDSDELMYVGSTISFNKRILKHKSNCNNEKGEKYNMPVYKYIRDNGGIDNFNFEIIFKVNCYNKYELELVERSYIDDLKPKMNKHIPTRTKKERYETDEEYRNNIKQKRADRYIKDKDVIKDKGRKYYCDNKETKINYSRDYYKKKKDELKEPIECDNCGKYVSKYCLVKHKKTNYCINFNKKN